MSGLCLSETHLMVRWKRACIDRTYMEASEVFLFKNQEAVSKGGRRCPGKVNLTAVLSCNKDMMSFVPWPTITKQFGKFVLIFSPPCCCFHSMMGWGSSVKAQSTKKSSSPFNIARIRQSDDMFPTGSCQSLSSIIPPNDTSL